MHEDDEAIWNWTSNSAASISLDGQKLHDVFHKIHQQLESLRRKNAALKEQVDVIGESGLNPDDHIQVELDAMKASLAELANLVASNENNSKSRIMELHNEISKMHEHNKNLDKKVAEHVQKFHHLEASFDLKIKELKDQFDDHVRSTKSQAKEFRLQIAEQKESFLDHRNRIEFLERNVTANKDTIAINEFKAKAADTKIVDLNEQLMHLRGVVEDFPRRYLERLNASISDLYAEKADRLELERKVDTNMVLLKADQSEISRLEELLEELHRRLAMQAREVSEGFNSLDNRLDKKTEKIAMWCLKQLRKEFKNANLGHNEEEGGGGGRGDGYGDIGRVRCLVCDQTIKQPQVAETALGLENFKNTMRMQHRSNSPPPAEQRQQRPLTSEGARGAAQPAAGEIPPQQRGRPYNNSNHTNNQYTSSAMAHRDNSSPVLPNVQGPPVQYSHGLASPVKLNSKGGPTQQHSKLVKMHNRPNEANITLNSMADPDDPDYVVDFKYRLSGTGGTTAGGGDRPVSAQMAPTVNGLRTSASNPTVGQAGGGGGGGGANPTRYFKDLDEKYSNGATRRGSADRSSRPKSAPLKRVASAQNKLFANGKPMLVDIVDVL